MRRPIPVTLTFSAIAVIATLSLAGSTGPDSRSLPDSGDDRDARIAARDDTLVVRGVPAPTEGGTEPRVGREDREPGCGGKCPSLVPVARLVTGNGPTGRDARSLPLNSASFIARDAAGNLFVGEAGERRILKVFPDGFAAVFAGDGTGCSRDNPCADGLPANESGLGFLSGIAVAPDGDLLFSDGATDQIRRIDAATRKIETLVNVAGVRCEDPTADPACGDGGPAGTAQLSRPSGIAFDSSGRLYIADMESHRVRRARPDPSTGLVGPGSPIETVAGNGQSCRRRRVCGDGGPATSGQLSPRNVGIQEENGELRLFVPELFHERFREVVVGGEILPLAGSRGPGGSFDDCIAATDYRTQSPAVAEADAEGNVLILDASEDFRRIDRDTGIACAIANDFGRYGRSQETACGTFLRTPTDFEIDHATGDIVLAVPGNSRIYRINADEGRVHECRDGASERNTLDVLAGSGERYYTGDGTPADHAPAGVPRGIAVDDDGSVLFHDIGVAFRRVRRIDRESGLITSYPSATPPERTDRAAALEFDAFGNLYLADDSDDLILRITPPGDVEIVAGVVDSSGIGIGGFSGDGGPATEARINSPQDLAFDGFGNLYFSSFANDRIRRIDAVDGRIVPGVSTITTVVGGGTSEEYETPGGLAVSEISIPTPLGLAVGPDNTLYFTERVRSRRVFELADAHLVDVYANGARRVTVIAGSGERCGPAVTLPPGPACGDFGPARDAALGSPDALAYDPDSGDLFVEDGLARRVRRLVRNGTTGTWDIEPFAGNSQEREGFRSFGDGGPATEAGLDSVSRMTVDRDGHLLFTESFGQRRVRSVDLASGLITTIAGEVFPRDDRELAFSKLSTPYQAVQLAEDLWVVADGVSDRVRAVRTSPLDGEVFTAAGYPGGFVDDGAIARFSRLLDSPKGVAWDGSRYVYVAESERHLIRRIDTGVEPWTIETWAGTDGVAGALNQPTGLAIDRARSVLYVANPGSHTVVAMSLDNPSELATVAGSDGAAGCPTSPGAAAGDPGTLLSEPVAVALDRAGRSLFVVDAACHLVRRISLDGGTATSRTVIGDGAAGDARDGIAGGTRLFAPHGAVVDPLGNLHVTSRDRIVTVLAGRDRVADATDEATVIYGDGTATGFEPYTECLSGIALERGGRSRPQGLMVLDRCLGFMFRLSLAEEEARSRSIH